VASRGGEKAHTGYRAPNSLGGGGFQYVLLEVEDERRGRAWERDGDGKMKVLVSFYCLERRPSKVEEGEGR
jgi:hypothetical protein